MFESVLNPGERIVWSYRPQFGVRTSWKRLAIFAAVPWLGSIALLRDASKSMATGHQAELVFVSGYFFALPIIAIYFRGRWARNTAYALTNRRVLMTVGPRRQDIRSLTLTQLGRVSIVSNRRLLLTWRLPGEAPFGPRSIWTNPDTGKADRWTQPYWRVPDPAAIQEMLENARNAVWYTPDNALPSDFAAAERRNEEPTAKWVTK